MNKKELRSSVNATFWNGILDVILKTLTSGSLLTAYVFSLKLGNTILGFLQALLSLTCLIHLPLSAILEKGISPKKIASFTFFIANVFCLLTGLSFLISNQFLRSNMFFCSITIFFVMIGIVRGAFWPWYKQVVPSPLLTSALTYRIKYISIARIMTVILATIIISFVPQNNMEQEFFIYGCLFFTAFLIGLLYLITLIKMPEVHLHIQKELSFCEKLRYVLTNKSFIFFSSNIGLANFSYSFFIPFTTLFLLKKLNFSVSESMSFYIYSCCIDIITINFWKNYAQKYTISKMLSRTFFCFFLGTIFLIYSAFYSVHLILWLIIAFTFIGLGTSGFNLGITDISIAYVPKEKSAIYISIVNIARFGFSALGSFIAGILLSTLEKGTIYSWGYFFLISATLFCCSGFFIKKIKKITS